MRPYAFAALLAFFATGAKAEFLYWDCEFDDQRRPNSFRFDTATGEGARYHNFDTTYYPADRAERKDGVVTFVLGGSVLKIDEASGKATQTGRYPRNGTCVRASGEPRY